MRIINITRNISLADDVILADTFFLRMKGLLGRRDLKKGQALILKPCNSVHTFFMHFPIDILFMDKNNRVVKIITDLVPFRISSIYFNAYSAIELPAGTIVPSLTNINDLLEIK